MSGFGVLACIWFAINVAHSFYLKGRFDGIKRFRDMLKEDDQW